MGLPDGDEGRPGFDRLGCGDRSVPPSRVYPRSGVAGMTRRQNVEYHEGAKAFRDGVALQGCPYHYQAANAGDSRFDRWNLGWSEAYEEAYLCMFAMETHYDG